MYDARECCTFTTQPPWHRCATDPEEVPHGPSVLQDQPGLFHTILMSSHNHTWEWTQLLGISLVFFQISQWKSVFIPSTKPLGKWTPKLPHMTYQGIRYPPTSSGYVYLFYYYICSARAALDMLESSTHAIFGGKHNCNALRHNCT